MGPSWDSFFILTNDLESRITTVMTVMTLHHHLIEGGGGQ